MTPQVIDLPETHPLRTAAPDRLEVVVAERHIDKGIRACSRHCPVAVALLEAGHLDVSVCFRSLFADGRKYRMPDDMGDWVQDFDHGVLVHPERWVLEPVRKFHLGTTQTVQRGGFST